MKSLVTGGCGFIGSHLTERLVKMGHDVVVIDIQKHGNKLPKEIADNAQVVVGDVCDESLVADLCKGCDYVFHLAASLGVEIVADNPVKCMEVETVGTKNIVHGILKHDVPKLVYASTSGVYGKIAIEKAVDEDFNVSPNSSYAIAKRYNEIYLKSLYQEHGLESLSLRYFNVYGPRQDNRMVIPRFIEQAQDGRPLTVYGSGKQTRDFTYIDDTIEGTILAAEKIPGCEIVNICYDREHSIHDLAKIITRKLNSSSEVSLIESPSGRYDFEVMRRIGDCSKLKSHTGYLPATSLDEGLGKTFDYMGVPYTA
jgi:UDP-glucose 4-epimerase